MPGGKWWFVTWTTFGTWLPGDPRGFRTWRKQRYVPPPRRYARPGERTYDPTEYRQEYAAARQAAAEPVRLSQTQRQLCINAFVEEIAKTSVAPVTLAVGTVHSHFLAKFGSLRIRQTVGRFKAAATVDLHQNGLNAERVWTRGCDMKSKSTREEFITAFNYVRRHDAEGATIHIWNDNIPDDCRFLIDNNDIPIDDLPF